MVRGFWRHRKGPSVPHGPGSPGYPDPVPASIWRNPTFVRVFGAATISLFGSLVTRTALPFTAILVLHAGPIEIAAIRACEIIGGVLVALVVGAWVDRLGRRPVMIVADLGQAIALGSVPVAAIGGWLSIGQLVIVAFATSILTTFHNTADVAYMPTVVEHDQLVAANSAMSASGSVAEFGGFSIGGFLVQILTAPIAIAVDAVSFLASAVILGTIRRAEPSRPTRIERRSLLVEIRDGLRPIAGSPVLRAVMVAGSGAHLLWGAFGAIYLVFATDELGLGPATIGLIAAAGGISSFVGALVANRTSRRIGIGPSIFLGLAGFTAGNVLVPLAPAGSAVLAIGFLVGQQLIGDGAATIEEISEISLLQTTVPNELLGRVNSTYEFVTHFWLLVGTVAAGVIGEVVGLRPALGFGLIGGAIALAAVWFSPLRGLRTPDSALPDRPLLPVEDLPLAE
jgi:MFS family permease